MDFAAEVERIVGLLAAGDRPQAVSFAKRAEAEALKAPELANALLRAYVAKLASADALVAIFAGSLVAQGCDPRPLAEALLERFAALPLGQAKPPRAVAPFAAAASAAWARDGAARTAARNDRALREALDRWRESHGPVNELAALLDAPDGELVTAVAPGDVEEPLSQAAPRPPALSAPLVWGIVLLLALMALGYFAGR